MSLKRVPNRVRNDTPELIALKRRAKLIRQTANDLILVIDEALEIKNPDEGHYGKRDWAMVEVLKCLRALAEALK